jgi:Tfp pilus assembly protein PilX
MRVLRYQLHEQGFVLVTLIFLVLAGVLLLAAMAYLYGTVDTGQALQNEGAQAFVSAESGDQYGVYWLETRHATPPPPTKGGPWYPAPPLDNASCPAQVTVTYVGKTALCKKYGYPYSYTVGSASLCSASGARATIVRTVCAKTKRGQVNYAVKGWAEQ